MTGATAIVVAVLQSAVAERLLDNKLGWFLGYISFPLYLVHGPIVWSAGSIAFVMSNNSLVITALVTLLLSLALSWPLAMMDKCWVSFLNARVLRLVVRSKDENFGKNAAS
jgi:peptidoglycan/LPS O-acetylase OafA/YrhL